MKSWSGSIVQLIAQIVQVQYSIREASVPAEYIITCTQWFMSMRALINMHTGQISCVPSYPQKLNQPTLIKSTHELSPCIQQDIWVHISLQFFSCFNLCGFVLTTSKVRYTPPLVIWSKYIYNFWGNLLNNKQTMSTTSPSLWGANLFKLCSTIKPLS